MQKKLIIFDMDGTLLDSSKSITKSINYVRNELDLPPFSVEKITKLINMPDQDLPKLFYENIQPYSECRKIFEKHYYKNCIYQMELYDGIQEMIQNLNNKYKMAVATNAYEIFAKKMIRHLHIEKYFQIIIGSDTINAKKPDPKILQYILDYFNIKKEEAVLIGDSLKDEEAAKNAGLEYIFAEWGFGESENPNYKLSLEKLDELEKILTKK